MNWINRIKSNRTTAVLLVRFGSIQKRCLHTVRFGWELRRLRVWSARFEFCSVRFSSPFSCTLSRCKLHVRDRVTNNTDWLSNVIPNTQQCGLDGEPNAAVLVLRVVWQTTHRTIELIEMQQQRGTVRSHFRLLMPATLHQCVPAYRHNELEM